MIIHLPEDLENSLRALVQGGRFASEDAAVAEAVRSFLRQPPNDRNEAETHDAGGNTAIAPKPSWERILEITAEVPDEEWDKLPADSSAQLDHYIYGTAKRPVS